MEILAAILLLLQIFTVFASIKVGLDMRDINNCDDDRSVYYRFGSGCGGFLWINFCGWILELMFVAVGAGIYIVLVVGPIIVFLYILWLESILIYDQEKIIFPYLKRKDRIIFFKDIDYLQKEKRKHKGGYDGKHLYSYYYTWHWTFFVNNRQYSVGNDHYKKLEVFLSVLQERYQVITGQKLRIEQSVGSYDQE